MSASPVGVLLLDKPTGLSSNAALQRVRRLAHGIKAGHCGSLDPLASGMLPICLGEATRLAGELLAGRKAYRFGLLLGERSSSGDAEGEIIERCAVPALTSTAVLEVLERFLGSQSQLPPMYSALKRGGVPLYRLARAGHVVPRAARTILIEELKLRRLAGAHLELSVLCSKGTYVRVLAEDIARALNSCGRLESLRREYVEPFAHEPMVSLEALAAASASGQAWPILGADRAVAHLPSVRLDPLQTRLLCFGQMIALPQTTPGRWRLYDAAGRFLGLGVSKASGQLRAQRLFSAPVAV